ncbi:MAG TPA: protein kinase [Isosphaeraceae bacterium]|nr:protein kinase [Isosphaeraceae bacterium]
MSIPSLDHPSHERLDAFVRGALAQEDAAQVEDHMEACPQCADVFAQTPHEDPLIEQLRLAGQETATAEPEWPQPAAAVSTIGPMGYEILEVIGRGGMGVVYKARQRRLGRVVALKQIGASLDGDPRELARFQAEAEATARLWHPGIVQIHDVGWSDSVPYLAMEFVEGGNLDDRLRRNPLNPRESAELMVPIARAVHHAHEAGVIHRDLKPGNILLTAEGAPKVADFGLAKRLDIERGPTQTGTLLGTPSYMAPEQAEGKLTGPPADIYALGAILYECLTGRPPFQAATPLETLERVRTCEPITPRRLQSDVPRDLQTICLKCLEKDPRRRYATAAELADDLGRFLRGEPVFAKPVGLVGRWLKWARRNPALAGLAALSVIAAAGALAGLIAHQARLQVEVNRANRAAKTAREQRALADANYREARAAIGQILDRLNEPTFAGIPRGSELRVSLTEAALGFYDRILSAADSPDPVVRRDTAVAAREAATLQIGLGRLEPAEHNLKRALQLLDGLAHDRPDDPVLLRERMMTWLKLGVMLEERDNPRSLSSLTSALKIAERLARVEANSPQSREDMAWCEHNLGSALIIAGRPSEAERHLQRAADTRRVLVNQRPDDTGQSLGLAGTLVNLGLIQSQDRPTLAEASYAEAERLLDAILATRPDDLSALFPLAELFNNWGNLAAQRGEPELALTRFARGLALIEPIRRSQPALDRPRTAALNLHGARGNLLETLGRHAESVPDREQVIEVNTIAADAASYRLMLAFALVRAGDHRRGVAEMEKVAKEWENKSPSGADLYNLACVEALATLAVERDQALAPDERAALSRSCSEQALKWLRRCADSGFLKDPANRDQARKDPDLDAIRGSAQFAEILRASEPPPASVTSFQHP